MTQESEEILDEHGDPGVPTELLEIHLELESSEMTPNDFKELFG